MLVTYHIISLMLLYGRKRRWTEKESISHTLREHLPSKPLTGLTEQVVDFIRRFWTCTKGIVYFAVLVVCCLIFGLRHRWSAVFDQSRAIDVAHNSSMRCGIKIRKAGPAEEGKSACRCRKCQGDRSDVSSSDAVVECVRKGSW